MLLPPDFAQEGIASFTLFTAVQDSTLTRGWKTWTKPFGCSLVYMYFQPGGAGGGGGFTGAAASNRGGGGGGGSSNNAKLIFPAFSLPEVLYIRPGMGGPGGPASTAGSAAIASYISCAPNTTNGNVFITSGGPGGGGAGSAAAGGTASAGSDLVVVTGTRNGQRFRVEVDLPSLFAAGAKDNDLLVQNGDIVWVDRQPLVYIYGEAQRPGPMRLERGMTLMQALSSGGGLTQRGTEKGIRVHRKAADGRVNVITPAMDERMQDGDVVYVRESLF